MDASEVRPMAIRARTMPYECPCGFVNTSSGIPALCDCCFELQWLHEDELDDNGKRLYLTRGKLRKKVQIHCNARSKVLAAIDNLRRTVMSVRERHEAECEVC